MKTIKISSCRLCKCKELIPVFEFGLQALSTRFPAANEPDAEILPLNLVQCQNTSCNLVQLTHDYDFNALYRKGYGYRSGINKTMRNHLSEIVNQLENEVKLKDNLDSLQNFRFQKALQQLEDLSLISNIKREIAQLNTVLREYDLGLRNESDKKE